MTPSEMTPPTVELQLMQSYFTDAPMMVGLRLRATAPDTIYMGLPVVQWFGDPLGAQWTVHTEGGEMMMAGTAEPAPDAHHGAQFGLDPGDEHRTLVDLAALLPALPAGRHTLSVAYPVDAPVMSAPVAFCVEQLSESDGVIVRRMRDGTGSDGTWHAFFGRDWTWTEVPPLEQLPAKVRAALALHIFLHRAFYGDLDVSKLPLEPLESFAGDLLEAEAAVLRHEIISAGGYVVAEEWKQYIARLWPGLLWRAEKSEQGFGFLRSNRDAYQQRLAYRPVDEIDSLLRP